MYIVLIKGMNAGSRARPLVPMSARSPWTYIIYPFSVRSVFNVQQIMHDLDVEIKAYFNFLVYVRN